jgi:hypothetical protein
MEHNVETKKTGMSFLMDVGGWMGFLGGGCKLEWKRGSVGWGIFRDLAIFVPPFPHEGREEFLIFAPRQR